MFKIKQGHHFPLSKNPPVPRSAALSQQSIRMAQKYSGRLSLSLTIDRTALRPPDRRSHSPLPVSSPVRSSSMGGSL